MSDSTQVEAESQIISKFGPSSTLTVKVGEGPAEKDFVVHQEFVCANSEFFRRAVNPNWKEAEERVVRFPEDDPRTFALWLHFAYTKQVIVRNAEDLKRLGTTEFLTAMQFEYLSLARLYVLAERLMDTEAKNAVVPHFFVLTSILDADLLWTPPGPLAVQAIWNGTPEGSPMRRLMVDLWTNVTDGWFQTPEFKELPIEFSHELLIETRADIQNNHAKMRGPSRYLEKK